MESNNNPSKTHQFRRPREKSCFMDENRFDAHVDIRKRAEEFLDKERRILEKIKKLEQERAKR